ncbi:MAG: ABC transporter ATP-binding protein [Deltaproteobacteria bacterium]|nr:ABC transporter ATP-binding protein [Deltaproteobacteria bacterium]
MSTSISRLYKLLDHKDRCRLPLFLFLVLLFSVTEMAGVGLLFPYFKILTDPSGLITHKYIGVFYRMAGQPDVYQFKVYISVGLVLFFLFKFLFTVFFTYFQFKHTRWIYNKLAEKMFAKFLKQPYADFVQANTAYYTKAVIHELHGALAALRTFLSILVEILTTALIFVLMLRVDFWGTVVMCVVCSVLFILMARIVSKTVKKQSELKSYYLGCLYRAINECFGTIKQIKINCTETFGVKRFINVSLLHNQTHVIHGTIQVIPRNLIEFIALLVLVIIVIKTTYDGTLVSTIPKLALFAVAFSRLVPAVNRMVLATNEINYNSKSIEIVSEYLKIREAEHGEGPCSFKTEISLKDLSFSFDDRQQIFNNINLTIQKGQKVGFVGESGVGKSTLVDIICGLFRPVNGGLFIDGVLLTDENIRSWRKKIGYIPQDIYLVDGTVLENVAFGFDVDVGRVTAALKHANIYDFLLTLDGLETRVGEGGVLLSGGQKQRIAIARALYNNSEVLVFDEATSALDSETEQKIIDEIYELAKDKTVIMVAHRLTTIKRCDFIYQLKDGAISPIAIDI